MAELHLELPSSFGEESMKGLMGAVRKTVKARSGKIKRWTQVDNTLTTEIEPKEVRDHVATTVAKIPGVVDKSTTDPLDAFVDRLVKKTSK